MIRIITTTIPSVMDSVEKFAKAETDKMMTDLHGGLMRATPVDTGRARNGWQLQLGQDPTIENQVPYVGKLNDGHSKQAPKMFIEAEINRVCKP